MTPMEAFGVLVVALFGVGAACSALVMAVAAFERVEG